MEPNFWFVDVEWDFLEGYCSEIHPRFRGKFQAQPERRRYHAPLRYSSEQLRRLSVAAQECNFTSQYEWCIVEKFLSQLDRAHVKVSIFFNFFADFKL